MLKNRPCVLFFISVLLTSLNLSLWLAVWQTGSASTDAPPPPIGQTLDPAADYALFLPFVNNSSSETSSPNSLTRVNAPFYAGDISRSTTAVFWFGEVTMLDNYADGRVGYNQDELYISISAFDRRLWYNQTPGTTDLRDWDAVSLYLHTADDLGLTPDSDAYQFVVQLNWWEARDNWQAAYRGNGTSWSEDSIDFLSDSEWRGNAPNDDNNDKGWRAIFRIPFSSLGLSGPPAQGDIWSFAVQLYDRDDATGSIMITDKLWPAGLQANNPTSWNQLRFGLTGNYAPAASTATGDILIRQSDQIEVIDAHVGGHTTCANEVYGVFFDVWGSLNYAGYPQINIQNQGDVADWPCFSKYYITFPLDSIPPDQSIISANLRMYLFGNAGQGWEPAPIPSLIQVMTVANPWDENTITWNNAPPALENIARTWVDPVDYVPPWPGIPYEWDVSQAAADAYARGEPLRLVLYSSDYAIHSGKYFYSSNADEAGRPGLRVVWGNP